MQARQLQPHLHAKLGVEIGERLVEQEDLGLADDRPADGDALALAARELRWLLLEMLLELQDPRCLADLGYELGLRPVRKPQAEGHVFEHGEVRVERVGLEHHSDAATRRLLLGDVAPFDLDLAGGSLLEPGDHSEERGLAAAGRADEDGELAAVDFHRDAVDDLGGPEGLLDLAELHSRHRITVLPWCGSSRPLLA